MTNINASDYRNFKQSIRSCNRAIFESKGAKLSSNVQSYGRYCFKMQGQIYHKTTQLHPSEGQEKKIGQLYILDTTQAVEQ